MSSDTYRAEAPHGGCIQSIQQLRIGRRFLHKTQNKNTACNI